MSDICESEGQSTRAGGFSLDNASDKDVAGVKDGPLPPSIKAHIERNRQRALLLKQAKLIPHPYAKINTSEAVEKSIIRVQGSRFVDTGGGFLLEEGDLEAEKEPPKIVEQPPPIIEPERPPCETCGSKIGDSYLLQNFDLSICDNCRDPDDLHALITRTEAKNEYLLKDADLDVREPPLKCIRRRNPHHNSWGEMRLYLQIQVEKRALEVWGSEEEVEKQRILRDEKREKTKINKYRKEMKELRMNVRSSLFDRTSKASHTHEFLEEVYHPEEDNYSHSCSTCGFSETFEKM